MAVPTKDAVIPKDAPDHLLLDKHISFIANYGKVWLPLFLTPHWSFISGWVGLKERPDLKKLDNLTKSLSKAALIALEVSEPIIVKELETTGVCMICLLPTNFVVLKI